MEICEALIEKLKCNSFDPAIDNPDLIPKKSGIYVICIKDIKALPDELKDLVFTDFGKHKILYIGLSRQGLKTRDYRTHFNGTARVSTLRKSLGVLFGFKKVQRESEIKTKKYKFNRQGEEELSQWMKENLMMHYCTGIEDVDKTESMLISFFNPPLNLAKNKNEINRDFRKSLSKLRSTL